MYKSPTPILLLVVVLSSVALSDEPERPANDDFGPYHREITTTSPEAQRHFDEGLTWMHAFNHDEAIRSFQQAAEADDNCAMAWWGISIASGPQYNHPEMTEERTKRAWHAMQEALKRLDHTTPVERALIEALKYRNVEVEPVAEVRILLNEAYAEALGEVWREYYSDPDVGALYAEALMVLKPWQLYNDADRTPVEGTAKIVATLERVLAIAPNHAGALHLYIHAVEPSQQPGRATFAADRLSNLVPVSGHLNHMPSHIYVQTGEWDKGIERNFVAMDADDRYQQATEVPAVQNGYIIHNTHMLLFAATMSGREKDAMTAARHMWTDFEEFVKEVPTEVDPELAYLDRLMCAVYDVQKRFGRWQELIDEKQTPPECLIVTQTIWRAHRAIAYAALHDFDSAEHEYELSRKADEAVPDDYPEIERARSLLNITDRFTVGEIALQRGMAASMKGNMEEANRHWDESIRQLEKAAEFEDAAGYGEPPEPIQPVRHTLGVAYMTAGKYDQAERVYREDLKKWPNNGWSLKGLSLALAAQKKESLATEVAVTFEVAWKDADNPITSSCLCVRDCCCCAKQEP